MRWDSEARSEAAVGDSQSRCMQGQAVKDIFLEGATAKEESQPRIPKSYGFYQAGIWR